MFRMFPSFYAFDTSFPVALCATSHDNKVVSQLQEILLVLGTVRFFRVQSALLQPTLFAQVQVIPLLFFSKTDCEMSGPGVYANGDLGTQGVSRNQKKMQRLQI